MPVCLDFDHRVTSVDAMPELPFKIMMNVGNPDRALISNVYTRGYWSGETEFIINRMIGVHPRALMDFDSLPADLKEEIAEGSAGTPIRQTLC